MHVLSVLPDDALPAALLDPEAAMLQDDSLGVGDDQPLPGAVACFQRPQAVVQVPIHEHLTAYQGPCRLPDLPRSDLPVERKEGPV
jgi:hypothetical protein